jgi:hypothetical protein
MGGHRVLSPNVTAVRSAAWLVGLGGAVRDGSAAPLGPIR